MKMKHMRYSANLRVFLGMLLAACFLATAAHADALFTGTFKLTNEVHCGKAVLGPGSYSLAVDQTTRSIIIRDARTNKIVAREFGWPDYSAKGDGSRMLIAVHGTRRAVYSVQLAGLGEVFLQSHPFAAGGGTAEEARNTEAIPVEVAKK